MRQGENVTRVILLQIGNETIQNHGGNETKTNGDNVEKVGHNPSPHSGGTEHGSEETALLFGELLFALPLLLVNGVQFLRVLVLRARTHIPRNQGSLSSGADKLRNEGDATCERPEV